LNILEVKCSEYNGSSAASPVVVVVASGIVVPGSSSLASLPTTLKLAGCGGLKNWCDVVLFSSEACVRLGVRSFSISAVALAILALPVPLAGVAGLG
jgi:hypothetical protein